MSKETIGIGVIGMGWMGQVHSRSYINAPLRFPDLPVKPRLVICSDNVEARAKSVQEIFGFAESTTDWQKVVAHPDVQAINIATPNNLHLPIVTACAEAGKHILCEKPVGRVPSETAKMFRIAQEANILTFVGFNYRWVPLVQHIRGLIQSGDLGELTNFRGRFFNMYGSNPYGLMSWRFDSDIAGTGVLGDLMAHNVDMAHFICGKIKRVVSTSQTFIKERPLPSASKGTHYSVGKAGDPMGKVTNEDYAGALVEFENGAQGTLETSRTVFGPKCQLAFDVNGTKGAAHWDFERMNELDLYLPTDDHKHDGYMRLVSGDQYPFHGNFVPGDGNGMGYEDLKVIEASQWLRSLASGVQSEVGFQSVYEVAKVHDAMIRSWESGTWEDVTDIDP